jgi:hypothetical protein
MTARDLFEALRIQPQISATVFRPAPPHDSRPPGELEAFAEFTTPDGQAIRAKITLFQLEDGRIGAAVYPTPDRGVVLRWDDGTGSDPPCHLLASARLRRRPMRLALRAPPGRQRREDSNHRAGRGGQPVITFTGAVGTADLSRADVIDLHQHNVEAIRRRISLIQAAGPGNADTREVITRLEADIEDQLELIELAKVRDYPYPLAGED